MADKAEINFSKSTLRNGPKMAEAETSPRISRGGVTSQLEFPSAVDIYTHASKRSSDSFFSDFL